MYLHHILSREDKELIKRVYSAQRNNPTAGDFADQIKGDMEVLEAEMDEETIARTSKGSFKAQVKERINKAAEQFLKDQQKTHSKINNIEYKKLKIQHYIIS